MSIKPDADAICICIDKLEKAPWLGAERASWPRHLFHITDVQNAASILASGKLLPRNRVQHLGLMKSDNASPSVISITDTSVQNFVRLYFRPKTPTFFRNEGIRPAGDRQLGSHCPIPIALLFDSREVLSRADSQFSDGNLAAGAALRSKARDLELLPFNLIYHNSAIHPAEDRPKIVFHRHAEVVVPRELPLDSLRAIAARSPAELKTLHTLLLRDYSFSTSNLVAGTRENYRACEYLPMSMDVH